MKKMFIFCSALIFLPLFCMENVDHKIFHGLYNGILEKDQNAQFESIVAIFNKSQEERDAIGKIYSALLKDLREKNDLVPCNDPHIQSIVQEALKTCNIKQKVEIMQTFADGDNAAFVDTRTIKFPEVDYKLWILAIRFGKSTLSEIIGTIYHECGHVYYKDCENFNDPMNPVEIEARADAFGYEHLIKNDMTLIAFERALDFLCGHHNGSTCNPSSPQPFERAKIGFKELAKQGISIKDFVQKPAEDLDEGLKENLHLVKHYFPEYFE